MKKILESKISEFKQFYDTKNEYHHSALNFFIERINSIKSVETITGRVKKYDECVGKFERKYLPKISAENTSYKIIDYFPTLLG